MKSVLMIFPIVKAGGVPTCNLNLMTLSKNCTYVWVARYDDYTLVEQLNRVSIGSYDLDMMKFSFLTAIKLLKSIGKHKIEIVHGHGKSGILYGCIVKFFKRLPLVVTLHGFNILNKKTLGHIHKLFYSILCRFADSILCVSYSEKKKFLSVYSQFSSKTKVIYNAITVTMKYDFDNDVVSKIKLFNKNYVTLSRYDYQKNLELMIVGFAKVLESNRDIALHIFGGYIEKDKQYYENIVSQIVKYRLENNVFLWGEYNSILSYLHYFDFYVSTARWEGLPTAIVEAMMSKIVVVGSDCVGNDELLDNGRCGIMFKNEDLYSYTSALKSSMDLTKSEYDLYVTNALDKAELFNQANTVHKIEKEYCEINKRK